MHTSSRYVSAVPITALDTRREPRVTYAVFRDPEPGTQIGSFRRYIWRQGDRWDFLAARALGNSRLWYRLLDFNPHVQDPFFVEPGTVIALPARGDA